MRRHLFLLVCAALLLALAMAPLAGMGPVVIALALIAPLFWPALVERAVVVVAPPLPAFVTRPPRPFRGPPVF